ncbi:GDSL-type esterase/lipase family protein [Streptomyces sp. NPDC059256]|uniref:GDSL-type esterase/lipase family protein n=1 Tax=Streptomyces sp. NPDC059256 TaxID=3346794 RepID=UPI0036A63A2C
MHGFSGPLRSVLALVLALTFTLTVLERPARAAPSDANSRAYVTAYMGLIASIRERLRAAGTGGTTTATAPAGAISWELGGEEQVLVSVRALASFNGADDPDSADVQIVFNRTNLYVLGFYLPGTTGRYYYFRHGVSHPNVDWGASTVERHELPFGERYANMGVGDLNFEVSREAIMSAVMALRAPNNSNLGSLQRSVAVLVVALAEGARFRPVVQALANNILWNQSWNPQIHERLIHNWSAISAAVRDPASEGYVNGSPEQPNWTMSRVEIAIALYFLWRHVPSPPGPKVPKVRVMALGDSITLGVGSTPARLGYRPALAAALASTATTVEFVGSQTDAEGNRHEGHSGWFIEGISSYIEEWLAAAQPNVVTLHIGSNNIHHGQNVAGAPAELGGLLDKMFAMAPDLTVLLAPIVPNSNPGKQALVNTFNAALPGIVQERRLKNNKVRLVDFSAINDSDLNDRLHPNNSGYQKMADAFHKGMGAAATDKWITENVVVSPPPPGSDIPGDYDVDLDGDGKAEYLVLGPNGSVNAYRYTTGTSWTDLGRIASGSAQWTDKQVRFADLDGDGKAEYLVLGPNGSVNAYRYTTGTSWTDLGRIASGSAQWTDKQVRI